MASLRLKMPATVKDGMDAAIVDIGRFAGAVRDAMNVERDDD